jgi:hypothetical protein
VPDRHHERKQKQRESDAQYSQDAPALVAERILGDEPGQSHIRNLILKSILEDNEGAAKERTVTAQ